MRILIFAIGSAGDVHPFLGVGSALRDRGHEVFVITSPYFEEAVIRCGLGFRALGTTEDFERLRDNPDLWHWRKGLGAVLGIVAPSYPPILDFARELHQPGNTVMLASSLAFGARNARELLGIPLATIHLAPAILVSTHRQPEMHGAPVGRHAPRFLKAVQWEIASRIVDYHLLPDLNRFRSRNSLPPVRDLLRGWWNSPDRVIGLFPDWFGPPQPDWPSQVRLTGFPLFDETGIREIPTGLAEFLDAGEPPVVFTPGSAMAHGHRFFQESVKALRLSGRRGILLSPFERTIPENLPLGVRHFPYIPFSQVLPRAAALVYHGGVGTCSQALQAGIPHFIQPMAHDQLDTLSRVRDLGVGLGLSPARFTGRRVAARLDELLGNPAFKSRAEAIANTFQSGLWRQQTCELVELLRDEARLDLL